MKEQAVPANRAVVAPASEQAATIAFLLRPDTFGPGTGLVERIETHCSIVFLVGDRAYKLKRAIVFSSVDYSTLARREAACRAEIALNQRTAPEIYLGVCAITRDPAGHLAFDRTGPVVDWLVVMRRFRQEDLFSALADQGLLTTGMMRALGVEIAALHRAAEIRSDFGGAAGISAAIANNHRELCRLGHLLDGAGLDDLCSAARSALAGVSLLLDGRRDVGKVRRCHGDLRLANICLFNGRPTLFDSIEFSEEIGCIDVLYDLAFLLMDLLVADRSELAAAVFNSYLDHADETSGLRALPLFLSVRAATRSYALADSATRHPDRMQTQLAAARRHLKASHELLRPPPARLIAVAQDASETAPDLADGLARLVPPLPGARVLHLPSAPAPAFWQTTHALLAAGCSVLLQGGFIRPEERRVAANLADAAHVPFIGIWLHAGPAPELWYDFPRQQADVALPAALAGLLEHDHP